MASPSDPADRADAACPADVVVWHGLMAGWMAVMLTISVSGVYDAVALGLFAAGTVWAGIRLAVPRSRAAYLRLCVCCGGMIAMLLPAATLAASSAEAMPSTPGMPPMPGMPGIGGTGGPSTVASAVVPDVVTALLLVALTVLVASQVRVLSTKPVAHRAARGLEIGTAAAMAVMLGLAR